MSADAPGVYGMCRSKSVRNSRVFRYVTVGEMDFPFSYKNMRFAYPTLIIEGSTGSKDVKNGYRYDLVIDKIILRRKD